MNRLTGLTGKVMNFFSLGKEGQLKKEALSLEKKRKYVEAIDKYLELLEVNPARKDVYVSLGSLYEGFNKYEQALEMYCSAVSLDADYSVPLESIKKVIQKEPSINISVDFFEKLFMKIITAKQKKTLLSLLGTIYKAKKEYIKAIEQWEILLDLSPKNLEALENLAELYSSFKEESENYEKVMEELFRKKPKDKDICLNLASLYHKKGNKGPEVIPVFLKAYDFNPDWLENTIALAKNPPLRINPQKLIEIYKKALELAGEDGEIYFQLGFIKSKQKKFDKAEKYFKKAFELGTGMGEEYDCKPLFELGKLYIRYKFKEKAIDTFKKILTISPDNPETLQELKKLLWTTARRKNLTVKELDILKKAFHIKPDIRNYNLLAEDYLKHKETDKAIELYNESLKVKSQKQIIEKLIALYEENKYWEKLIEALRMLNAFSKKKEEKIDLLCRQSDIYIEKLGDKEKARNKLEKILKLDSTNIEAHEKLFYISYISENHDNISENFSGLIDSNPLSENVYSLIADVLSGQENFEQSLYAEQIALLLSEEKAEVHSDNSYSDLIEKRLPIVSDEKFEELVIHQNDKEFTGLFGWTKTTVEQFYTYEIDKDVLLNCVQVTEKSTGEKKKEIYGIIKYCCNILLTDMPGIYIYSGKEEFETAISKNKEKKAFIIVNQDFLDRANVPEKHFIIGRNICFIKKDNIIYKQFSMDLPALIADFIINTVVTTIPLPIPKKMNIKNLPVEKVLKHLKDSALPTYFQDWSKKVINEKNMIGVIEKMLKGLEITADRTGLICCANLEAATTALIKYSQNNWLKTTKGKEFKTILEKDKNLRERLINLWKFALQPEFLEIFKKDEN